MHPSCLGLLLDILEAAIDHRVEGIELALDLLARTATVAPRRSATASTAWIAAPAVVPPASVALIPVARAIALASAGAMIAVAARGLTLGSRCAGRLGGASAFARGG
jgi:hypothetical protein